MDHIINIHREEIKRHTTVNHKGGQFLLILADRYVQRLGLYSGCVLSTRIEIVARGIVAR